MSLLTMIKDAGVVGAGGAGFPTHAKLSSKAEFILLNGAECEPLLRVDQQLMKLFPAEIIKGLVEAGRFIEAGKAIIGIKGKHKEVIALMRQQITLLGLEEYVEVKELPDIYPAGDEQVLVYELTGRVVPEAGIPIQVGCVVINSETALNIDKAIQNIPVTEKYLTVAGDVMQRLTLKVPVGTPIKEVLKLSGIEDLTDHAVIDGGPMMGPVMKNIDGFVTKKTKGFVILKKKHPLIIRKTIQPEQAKRINRSSCEQCRMCTDLCPRYLLGHEIEPHKMMRAVNYSTGSLEELKNTYLCCQCNLCELFSCPAGLYPKSANQYLKQKLMTENIRFKATKSEFKVRTAREFRLVPSKRLIARLGLHEYDVPAPMTEVKVVPETVYILKSQHVGAPAEVIVSVGELVTMGQLIGKLPEEGLSAAIHASISGTVTEISKDYIAIRRN